MIDEDRTGLRAKMELSGWYVDKENSKLLNTYDWNMEYKKYASR